MLISTRSRYGLRALVRLAALEGESPVSLAKIAEDESIPIRYLEQIFIKLRDKGIVKGLRGPGGGYSLGMPSDSISIMSVVSLLENDFLPTNCVLPGFEDEQCESKDCDLTGICRTRQLWANLRALTVDYLKRHTIADLLYGRLEKLEG
jgi:Rrf2 family iron-sulfur cluster assembly transcriptional regulator